MILLKIIRNSVLLILVLHSINSIANPNNNVSKSESKSERVLVYSKIDSLNTKEGEWSMSSSVSENEEEDILYMYSNATSSQGNHKKRNVIKSSIQISCVNGDVFLSFESGIELFKNPIITVNGKTFYMEKVKNSMGVIDGKNLRLLIGAIKKSFSFSILSESRHATYIIDQFSSGGFNAVYTKFINLCEQER